MKEISAFCPAGISCFFQAHTKSQPPINVTEANHMGARGGGFILEKGVSTRVRVAPSENNSIKVTINGKLAPDAKVTRTICTLLLKQVDSSYSVMVDHEIEVPIGAGYGTSAAGTLSTGLALSRAIGLKMTLNQIAQFAHFAEIFCATGLGTVSGVTRGGIILILEPGAPGFDKVDWFPLDSSLRIITASFAPIPKDDILFSKKRLVTVNREAAKVMKRILDFPDLSHFLNLCYQFAKKAGFLTPRVKTMIDMALSEGALGASQNMIGEAFHVLVDRQDQENITDVLKSHTPNLNFITSKISSSGPRYS